MSKPGTLPGQFRDCWLTSPYAWVVSGPALLGYDVPAGGKWAASAGSVLAGRCTSHESCQLELLRLEHHASQECSSANVALISVTEIPFTIFLLQLSFGEWWLFKAFKCWCWTNAWLFNESHVASWHLRTQCLLYFAYTIASAVFSQTLVGMPHTGWLIFIYVMMYLLWYPGSSKTSWQTSSGFTSGVAMWVDLDAFQYTYFLIPLTCRT